MRTLARFAVSSLMAAALCLCGAGMCRAQEPPAGAASVPAQKPAQNDSAGTAAMKLTLQDALARARKNSVQFQSALTDSAIARQDKWQAGAALLPSVTYNNQAWYTQGKSGQPIFIANNGVHEYLSQGDIHESLDLASISSFRRSAALAAAAKARAEIASRGLVVTVVEDYYSVAATQQKVLSAQKAAD